jgi:membrane protein required for colicin V production
MTALDWVIIAIFAVSLVAAAINGFFVELFSIAGWIAGIVVAAMYYSSFAHWLMRHLHSAPAADALAFLTIALCVLIAAGMLGRGARWLLRKIGLGWADRLLGVAIGAAKGCLLATALAMGVAAFSPGAGWVLHSQLLPYFLPAAGSGSEMVPGAIGQKVRQGLRAMRKNSPRIAAESNTFTF